MILYRRTDGSGGCCVVKRGEPPPRSLDTPHWKPEPKPVDPQHPPQGLNIPMAREALSLMGFFCLSARSLTHIAAALDFSEPAAFTRAFRRWSGGVTPSAWRAQHRSRLPEVACFNGEAPQAPKLQRTLGRRAQLESASHYAAARRGDGSGIAARNQALDPRLPVILVRHCET
jgi:AraC-like DNA-binding protein